MIKGEYKGVRYEETATGWRLRWPSGVWSIVQAADEAAVKAIIDGVVV